MPTTSHSIWPENTAIVHDNSTNQWLLFRDPVQVHTVHDPARLLPMLEDVEEAVADGLFAAGFISYEAGSAFDSSLKTQSIGDFPLAWFGLYEKMETIQLGAYPLGPFHQPEWQSGLSAEQYNAAIQELKHHIEEGDTYQVNYTLRMFAPFHDDPWQLFLRMIRAQGDHYGAYVRLEAQTICSASPELFFQRSGNRLDSRPMKGTIHRGLYCQDDRRKAEWLRHSEKNQAENVMIVDMVRNDFGRVAERGSVRVKSLFDLEKYPTLWQMTSSVSCETEAGLAETMKALFPSASITGAPKARTMEIIADLEHAPRKLYTGTIGFLAPGGRSQFNVAIRTVLVDHRRQVAEYGVGGGITWDSEDHEELRECYTKAKIMTQKHQEFSLLETLCWTPDDGYLLLESHLGRLANSADYFSREVDLEKIRGKLSMLARELPRVAQRIRLLVPEKGEAEIEVFPLGKLPAPYRVCLAKRAIDSQNVFLYHKTTCREVYEKAKRECPGANDVILWNERGEITESCIANVVLELDGRLLTPPVDSGLLAGTERERMLVGGILAEAVIRVEDLERCSKLYLINSVRGMWEPECSF